MFATFMYVVNKGQFSSIMTLTAFYANLAVLIIFNIIVNNNTNNKSATSWIGKKRKVEMKYFYKIILSAILVNSWSSVLSFNHFNQISYKNIENVGHHESTFVRQTLYFLINLASNIG